MVHTKTALTIAAVCAAAALLCIIEAIGSLRPTANVATTLTPASFPPLVATGFIPGGVFPQTDASDVPAKLRLYGSFIHDDRNMGEARSAWYDAAPDISVMVAGYPAHSGITLELEVDTAAGIVRLPVTGSNPGEHWTQVSVPLRDVAQGKRFRVHAVDHSATFQGWVGFSEPFVVGTAPSAQMFGAVGRIAIYLAAFLALSSAVICSLLVAQMKRQR